MLISMATYQAEVFPNRDIEREDCIWIRLQIADLGFSAVFPGGLIRANQVRVIEC